MQCVWISPRKLQRVAEEVAEQANGGGVTCYDVVEHVRENLLRWAGAVEGDEGWTLTLDTSALGDDEDMR